MDALDRPHPRVHTNRGHLEDTRKFNTVTGLAEVDQVVVDTDRHGVWCLSRRNGIGGFLKLDNLLILERAAIVDDLQGVLGLASCSGALRRFADPTPVQADVH